MFHIYNPYVVACTATIGGMLFGFDISSVSAFVSDDKYRQYFNYPDSTTQGGITASMAGGSFLGSLASGYISDKSGRKSTIQIAAIIWIIGAAIQCSSQNIGQLIAGRVISGVAIGLCSSQVPVYIAEVSPRRIRGRLVGVFQWAVTWGIMIMFYISFGCTHIAGPASFRTAWGIQMVPGLLLEIFVTFLPESPRWLAAKDRWEEAQYIIAKVTAKGDINDPEVAILMQEIREVISIERQAKSLTLLSLFKTKTDVYRTMTGISAQIWQQLCGMNVMMYYIVYIFDMAGYQGNATLVASSIQYVINVVMTIPALLFIDSWGRRPLLLLGAALMSILLFATGAVMKTHGHWVPEVNGNDQLRWVVDSGPPSKAVIALSYLFVASFAPTWGPGIWVYVSEIFPLEQRALANGACAAANWIFNFALAFFVPPAFKNIQWQTYMIFGTFAATSFIQVYLSFPETKDKTLEEIGEIWESKVPAWRTGGFQSHMRSEVAGVAQVSDDHKFSTGHVEHVDTNDTEMMSPQTTSAQDETAVPVKVG